MNTSGRLAVTWFLAGSAIVLMAGCGAEPDRGSAVGTGSASTDAVDVEPVGFAAIDDSMILDCVDYTQFAAYVGDAEMLKFWTSVGQDPDALWSACEEIGRADPGRLEWFSTRQRETEEFLAAAATTAPAPTVPQAPVPLAAVPPNNGCDPNYTGACVPMGDDVDCAGGEGDGPSFVAGPVYVVGADPNGLDRDGDRVACEPSP